MSEDRPSPHEVVIVRRRGGGHDDGHHGGAWKIAFADFMTALMCFFLVMWLINSTDKKTVAQIASYFNPLKLNDRQPSQKGVHDPGPPINVESEEVKEKPKDKKEKEKKKKAPTSHDGPPKDTTKAESETASDDQELLRDPYGALERIVKTENGSTGFRMGPEPAKAGDPPLDSFDQVSGRVRAPADMKKVTVPDAKDVDPRDTSPAREAAVPMLSDASGGSKVSNSGPGVQSPNHENRKEPVGDNTDEQQRPAPSQAAGLQRQIDAALADIKPGNKPDIEVVDQKTAVLISLTDEFDFGMFAVGSASPTREVVMVMERIAKVIANLQGNITVRGHTDARQYHTPDKDNWRLSMARAQMAFYMLVRGGIPEKRMQAIEGHADQALKAPSEPLAARNRRIEILIEKRS